jgi:hypothetical protein
LAVVLGGAVMATDLMRANFPWVQYYNYREKYASNAVIDQLRERPHEQRVGSQFPQPTSQSQQAIAIMSQVYGLDWKQHLFPYYNIQSVDVVQEPRVAEENGRYRAAFLGADAATAQQRMVRFWELTSTRYFVSLAGMEQLLDQVLDAGRDRFRLFQAFQLYQEREGGPILTETNAPGPFAILEFTGALSKASLFSRWEVIEDPAHLLERLVDPGFDPAGTVLLETDPWPGATLAEGDRAAGVVAFESYAPKHLRISVEASAPSVLLLNDKHHPDWQASLDGQPAEILRANFLMRGLAVPPGRHLVEFRYRPSVATWYVSLAAVLAGLGLCAFMSFTGLRKQPEPG